METQQLSKSQEAKRRRDREISRIKGYIKDSTRARVSSGKYERTKTRLPEYWNRRAMDEVCEKWRITSGELMSIFDLYRFHVRRHMNDLSYTLPLHLQYTGYRVPGAGYFLTRKDWMVMDLLEYGVITPEDFPKWKVLKQLEPKAHKKKSIITKFINKVLKVVEPLGVKRLY